MKEHSGYPSLTEEAYALLKHEILTLHLAPGSKLAPNELKSRLQTGAAPIREALSRLSGEGLVDAESQRGFWVAGVNIDDLQQLGDLRSTLEIMAFRHAMKYGHEKLHDRLSKAWQSFQEIGQRAGENAPLNDNWEMRHRAFHFAFFSGYDSPTTVGLYENVYERFDRYRRLGVAKKGSLAGVIDDHSKLIDLVRISDVDAGCVLIKRHVDDVVEIVRQNASWT
jgi:GntR family carbon starvation induced transcriptional regulator